MSTLWTPDGERPIRREPDPAVASVATPTEGEPTDAEVEAEMSRLAQQLADTPAETVVANHAYGLFQLASLHLSLDPPQLPQARLAVDALEAIVEGLEGRLEEAEPQLVEALAQLRMAYVQIHRSASGSSPNPAG